MRQTLILLILFLISFLACNNGEKTGEKAVICPEKPLKGIVELQIRKVLTIDSLTIDKEKPPIFGFLTKGKNDDIYIGSNRPEIRIYKFSNSGTFLREFLQKGEGPGEVKSIFSVQYLGESIIVNSDRKSVEFDLEGNYISETKFKRSYHGIVFIDRHHFLANYYEIDEKDKTISRRICSIFNKSDEKEVVELLKSERENIGNTKIKDREGKTLFTVSLSEITPDYKSVYSTNTGLIYQCLTKEPQIYIKDRKGNLRKMIKTNFKSRILTDNDKNEVMMNFTRFPDDFKKLVKKNLPKEMVAISSIQLLLKNYFAVYFNKNLSDYEIWLFDEEGKFQYIIVLPEEPSRRYSIFTKNGFACIERSEDRDLYVEYEITNLPEIFTN